MWFHLNRDSCEQDLGLSIDLDIQCAGFSPAVYIQY